MELDVASPNLVDHPKLYMDTGFDKYQVKHVEPFELPQPVEQINIKFDNGREFAPPFTTAKEYGEALIGREHEVLVSSAQKLLISLDLVQCSVGLLRNRRTNMISLIHESEWSDAASAILSLQRSDDQDLIVVEGLLGTILYEDFEGNKKLPPDQFLKYRKTLSSDTTKLYRSFIHGLTAEEIDGMRDRSLASSAVGNLNYLKKIAVPIPKGQSNRLSVLYKPANDQIYLYESGVKKVFSYKGFGSK